MALPGGGVELKSIPGHFRMEVLNPFLWIGQERRVEVPAGYCFDGASIPRVFWSLIGSPWGEFRDAACIHDYLYSDGHGSHPDVSRKEADRIFRRVLLEVGIPRRRAALLYYAVRVGGRRAWRDYRIA